MFWVYLLKCADGSYYTGHTDNLESRLARHHQKEITSCYTATRLPVELVFSQPFPTRDEALASERQIKGWSRRKKEALTRNDWESISFYAKRKRQHAKAFTLRGRYAPPQGERLAVTPPL